MVYTCEHCCFTSKNKYDYEKHLLTRKHQSINALNHTEQTKNTCQLCHKQYASRMGLWSHKKKHHTINQCDTPNAYNFSQDEAIQPTPSLSEFHEEMKQLMIMMQSNDVEVIHKRIDELNAKLDLILSKSSPQTNYNISGNNIVNNINIFLNTECKDAITLTEFIKNIEVPIEMTKKAGQLTYDGFIANVFRENIQRYALTERPIHCVDVKKEECHVKNDEGWTTDKGEGMKKIQDNIYKKQMNNLSSWSNEDTMTWKEDEKTAMLKANKTSFGPDDDEEFTKLRQKARRMCREVVLFESGEITHFT
uniref:C2H2-type domain-containing protein n=1 Tax=viral metagenome TaxID=1070528 RepID=A0A6C0BVE8_9ZZZZ